MQDKILDVLTNKGFISSTIQLVILYFILEIPNYFLYTLYLITGHLSFSEHYIIGSFLLLICLTYYCYIIYHCPKFMGYIKDRSELQLAVLFYFIYMLYGGFSIYFTFIVLDFILPVFGELTGTTIKILPAIWEFMYSIIEILNSFFILIVLGVISCRAFFGKYKYRNPHKGRSVEELKAVLSPAALKVYETKDSPDQENK